MRKLGECLVNHTKFTIDAHIGTVICTIEASNIHVIADLGRNMEIYENHIMLCLNTSMAAIEQSGHAVKS